MRLLPIAALCASAAFVFTGCYKYDKPAATPASNTAKLPYHDDVQKRFGFDDNTMAYLSAYKWAKPLLEKLATKK